MTTTNQILNEIGGLSNAGDVESGPLFTAGEIFQGGQTPVSVATVGAATLTAAQLLTGTVLRSGSTAAYTDTTDTAANILAAMGVNVQAGSTFRVRIYNSVAFVETIAAGSGVTLSGTTAIAASTWRDFIGVVNTVSTPAITLYGIGSGTL